MSWSKEINKTPTQIGPIKIELIDNATDGTQLILYTFEVYDQNGEAMKIFRRENLQPHLAANEKTQLSDFLSSLRTKAEVELL